MSQTAPLPRSVFRFTPEIEVGSRPGKTKTLTSTKLIRGLRPQPSDHPGAQVALPQSPILRNGNSKITNRPGRASRADQQSLNSKPEML
jgi:hypothetical protein